MVNAWIVINNLSNTLVNYKFKSCMLLSFSSDSKRFVVLLKFATKPNEKKPKDTCVTCGEVTSPNIEENAIC